MSRVDQQEASPSTWRRLSTTPVSDLLRGRLSGRLDVRTRLAHYHLPAEVIAHAERIARRTRLGAVERAEIAVTLAEEAALSMEEGLDASGAIAAMGTPRVRGRELRRARLRGRPWPVRAFRSWRRRVGFTLLVTLGVYGAWVARFHWGTPQIKRNIAAEYNARFAAIPESGRGVTAFREAVNAFPGTPLEFRKRWPDYWPADPEWPDVKEFLAQCRPSLEAVRRAAAAEVFGMQLTDGFDPSWSLEPENRATQAATPGQENPPLIGLMLPQLNGLRSFARLLMMDARVAADERDAERVVADLSAMLGLARHARETPIMINDLVGIAIMAVAADATGTTIELHPGLLGDGQLAALSGVFASFAGGGPIPLRLEGERAMVDDWVQRAYTDDGHGDGRLCMEGLKNWIQMADPSADVGFEAHFIGPYNALSLATRKETTDMRDHLMGLIAQDLAEPRWKRGELRYEAEIDRLQSDPVLERKYRILLILAPAFAKASNSTEQASLQRDGLLMALAVERFRLRHGSYPERLEQVVPEFAPQVAVDTFDGQPLRYRLEGGRPLIYSVGGDTDDDGGRMAAGDRNWKAAVWRPPGRRALCPDGDWILWPPYREPRPQEETPDAG